jgi:hypothetical protein
VKKLSHGVKREGWEESSELTDEASSDEWRAIKSGMSSAGVYTIRVSSIVEEWEGSVGVGAKLPLLTVDAVHRLGVIQFLIFTRG